MNTSNIPTQIKEQHSATALERVKAKQSEESRRFPGEDEGEDTSTKGTSKVKMKHWVLGGVALVVVGGAAYYYMKETNV